MASPKGGSFEKDLEKLEEIVAALEEGGLSLDDSLKQFEQGIKLSRKCEQALTEAEKKIEILTQQANGEVEAVPFDDAADQKIVTPAAPAPAPVAPAAPPDPPEPPVERDPYEELPPDEELF